MTSVQAKHVSERGWSCFSVTPRPCSRCGRSCHLARLPFVEWGSQDDVSFVPKARPQFVAARSVAEALADLAIGSGGVPESDGVPSAEIAGPREERLVEVARLLAARRGDPLRIEEVSNPARHPSLSARLAATVPRRT
jgi:hypothetical protein